MRQRFPATSSTQQLRNVNSSATEAVGVTPIDLSKSDKNTVTCIMPENTVSLM